MRASILVVAVATPSFVGSQVATTAAPEPRAVFGDYAAIVVSSDGGPGIVVS